MQPRWTVGSFMVVWLAGLAGAGLLAAAVAALAPDVGVDTLVVWGLAAQYGATLLVFLLYARRRGVAPLGLAAEPKDALWVGVGMLSQIVVALLLYPLAIRLFPDGGPPQEIGGIITSPDTSTMLKVALFLTAVLLAPFFEELLFRGILLRSLVPRGRVLAIAVSAVVFMAIHIPGLSAENRLASAIVVLPPLLVLGLVLAHVTLRTGRLGPALFMHSGWNLVAALVLLIPREVLEQLEQMGG